MERVPVKTKSQSFQSLVNINSAAQDFINRRKKRQDWNTQNIILPPTEETINYLNKLAQQYPFCVNYKQKHHDPL